MIPFSRPAKLEENNAADVMAALAEVGPLAVNVDASNWHKVRRREVHSRARPCVFHHPHLFLCSLPPLLAAV